MNTPSQSVSVSTVASATMQSRCTLRVRRRRTTPSANDTTNAIVASTIIEPRSA